MVVDLKAASTLHMVKEQLDLGIETGINIDKIAAASRSLKDFFNKRFAGKCIVCLNATTSN